MAETCCAEETKEVREMRAALDGLGHLRDQLQSIVSELGDLLLPVLSQPVDLTKEPDGLPSLTAPLALEILVVVQNLRGVRRRIETMMSCLEV